MTIAADRGVRAFRAALAGALLVTAAAGIPAARAAGNSEAARLRSAPADPYAGVVTDSTVTFIGQDFYRAFVATWRELGMSDRYTLSIIERPSARWGSLVWVEYAHRRVYTTFLSPGRRDLIGPAGEQAARSAYESVVDADVQRLLFKDPDLAPDEF